MDNLDDHFGLITACEEFQKKAAGDPLLVVSHGIKVWHLFKVGKTDSAVQTLKPMISYNGATVSTADLNTSEGSYGQAVRVEPLYKAGSDIARGWLTRIDREQVKQALQKLYLREIEYPASLAAIKSLPKDEWPPLSDRWGKPWSYRLVDYQYLKGIRAQKYELRSTMLGNNSDLSKSLDIPYGSRINIKPIKLVSTARGKETMEFISTGENQKQEKVYLSVGTESSGITFAYLGSKILILTDGDHWMILPRPK